MCIWEMCFGRKGGKEACCSSADDGDFQGDVLFSRKLRIVWGIIAFESLGQEVKLAKSFVDHAHRKEEHGGMKNSFIPIMISCTLLERGNIKQSKMPMPIRMLKRPICTRCSNCCIHLTWIVPRK